MQADRGIAAIGAMRMRVAQREAEAAGDGRAASAARREQQQGGHGRCGCKGLHAVCARGGLHSWRAHELPARECEGLRTQRSRRRRPRLPRYSQPRRRGPPRERDGRGPRRRWETAGRPARGLIKPAATAPAQTGQETLQPPEGAARLSCQGVGDEADFKQWAAAVRQRRKRRQGALEEHEEEYVYFGHVELLDAA